MKTKDTDNAARRYIISAIVENCPGVLARVVGLFSARGFNIATLNVGEMENPQYSRITITVSGDMEILEQVRKQLEKLIDTLKVMELSNDKCIVRDSALIKLSVPAARRAEAVNLITIFRADIVDVSERQMIVEIHGDEDKIQNFLRLASPYGIDEMVRAGSIALKCAN